MSELYDIDVADVLSSEVAISFSHSTFSDRGYVHNNFEQKDMIEKVISVKDDEIALLKEQGAYLKEQVEHLKKQNDQLLKMLESRK